MRWLVVLVAVAGCLGDSAPDYSSHWKFTAIVNAGIGDQALDLSAGARMASNPSGVQIDGDDYGSCDHSFSFVLPAPLTVQTYDLRGPGTYVAYRDCRFGDMNIGAGSGSFTVHHADSTCARPPCIDAEFQFSSYVNPPQGFTAYFGGAVSNY